MAPYEINLPSLEIPLPRERSNWVLPRINPVGPSTAHPSLIIHPRTLKKKKSDLVRLKFWSMLSQCKFKQLWYAVLRRVTFTKWSPWHGWPTALTPYECPWTMVHRPTWWRTLKNRTKQISRNATQNNLVFTIKYEYQSTSPNCSFSLIWINWQMRLIAMLAYFIRQHHHHIIKRKFVEYTFGPVLLIGGGESWVLACSMAMKSSTCMEGGRLVFCLRDRNMSFIRGLPRPRGTPLMPRPPPRIGAVVATEKDKMRKKEEMGTKPDNLLEMLGWTNGKLICNFRRGRQYSHSVWFNNKIQQPSHIVDCKTRLTEINGAWTADFPMTYLHATINIL